MARPQRLPIVTGITSWNTTVDDMFRAIFDQPFPVVVRADVATLTTDFPPAQYDQCLAAVTSPSTALYISDGSAWNAV